ncbi:MAG: large conductance mechanosensitive channel protein MscL [Oscillospiraceae bacterium]|nr:large conductance mechanosensitive channel protein MscL [Oscillospiraceae bacterium]
MKKFLEEFKTFITKGNVLDMAVGVIVGGAFGAITTALVGNVITPLLAVAFKAPNTDALNITLRPATEEAEAIVLGLGTFVGAILNFLILALVLFCVIRAFNKARELAERKKKAEEEAAAAAAPAEEPKPTTEELLGEILEELKKRK